MIYRTLIRPVLFRMDAEQSHDLALAALGALDPVWRKVAPSPPSPPSRLASTVCGLRFPSPIGLAAGFDKAARALWAWPALGFGFVEVGTVTARPQPGNPKPRIFRLPEDLGLINRLGFPSPGADAMARRLAAFRAGAARRRGGYPIPLGLNIGRSRAASNEEAIEDHRASLERLHPYADFLVVNISSPNTPELRALQMRGALVPLLDALADRNRALGEKPLFVKVAPDLSRDELEAIADAVPGRAHGIVATNTTVRREHVRGAAREEAGGLSGRPLRPLALEAVRTLWRATAGRVPLIGAGGVFTADDVYEMMKAGASLVEIYTGFIYGGPGTPRQLARGLERLLVRDGFATAAQAVGAERR